MSTRSIKYMNFISFLDIMLIANHKPFYTYTELFVARTLRRENNMVLIISASKKKAQVISDIFYYMGVVSYAANPKEAWSEMSSLYRAALILDPEELADAESFVEKLRSYAASIPVFAISDNEKYNTDLYDGCFKNSIYSSTLIEQIVRYQNDHRLPLTAHYRIAGIDASCDSERVTVFDKSTSFTKTETMILRYLIAAYPIPQSAKNIIKYAYKPTKKPEMASIRTHISVMNKKFREITGRNLFVGIEKEGYVVSTPEILTSLTV